MPRRNHHARPAPDADRLAATLTGLAAALPAVSDGKFPCAGCRRGGHWNGHYCEPCKGRLILDARKTALAKG